MPNALFDPIINSEDEMLMRAHLQGRRYHACTYLRAYIMASLCFEPKLVVTDTAAILNRAFRTLIDRREGPDYNMDHLPVPDFDWLIDKGHIEFASRDDHNGNFTDLLREFREKKKNVDFPQEEFTEKLDTIYRDKYMHKYDINEATKKFTTNFRGRVRDELADKNTLPEMVKILRHLTNILSDQEELAYNSIKLAMEEKLGLKRENPQYQHIRWILRQAYDYNIPEILELDYCRSLQGIKPSRKQAWRLDLDREKRLEVDFNCSIYGLAALPARNLSDIWGSSEYKEFEKQLRSFRNNTIEIEEYIESLQRYILKINDVVSYYYDAKNNDFYEKGKLSRLIVRARQYFCSDSACIVIAKSMKDAYNMASGLHGAVTGTLNGKSMVNTLDWEPMVAEVFFNKVLPCVAKRIDGFPDPPEEIKEAVVMKRRDENGNHDDTGK